jgi:hypothetical protein
MTHGGEVMTMTVMVAPAATVPAVPTEAGLPPTEAVIPPQREAAVLPPKEGVILLPKGGVALPPKEDVPPSHPAGDVHLNHPPAEDGHPTVLPTAVIPVPPPGVIPVIPGNNVMQADSSPAGPDGPVMAAGPVRAAAAAVVPAAAGSLFNGSFYTYKEIEPAGTLFLCSISGRSGRNSTGYFHSASGITILAEYMKRDKQQ